LRGFPALVVLIHHAFQRTNPFIEQKPPEFVKWLNLGYLGFDIFFVISGFVIMHIHQKYYINPKIMSLYIKKRVLRIYPIYWPVGIGIIFCILYFRIYPRLMVDETIVSLAQSS